MTTVGGNADVTRCTENALRLLHAYGRDDVPVAEGAAGALLGSVVRATEVHGESGIGTTRPRPGARRRARPEGAVALIARILEEHPEPVAIAPIGPLTNIALVLRLYPHLASRISHLCLMGGSIGEGNTTASAEFNIIADPEAADVVFRSGVPITMIGLDVTHQALLDRDSAAELRALGTLSGRVAADLTDYALDRNMEWSGSATTAIHDAVAVAHLMVQDLVAVAPYHVAVDTTERARARPDGVRRPAVPAPARRPPAQRRRRHRHRPRPVRAAADRRVRPAAVAPDPRTGGMAARLAPPLAGLRRVPPRRRVCGARRAAQRERAATVSPSPAALRYVALGDSYTIGTSVAADERWPDQLSPGWPPRRPPAARSSSSRTTRSTGTPRAPSSGASCRGSTTTRRSTSRRSSSGSTTSSRACPRTTYRADVDTILGALLQRLPPGRILCVETPDYTVTPQGAAFGDPRDAARGDRPRERDPP